MPNIKDANISSIRFAEQGSTPTTPATGFWRLYAKSDGLYIVDDAGVATGPFTTASALAALVLNDLSDVVITGTPADGEVLTWDSGTSKWVNEAGGGGGGGLTQAQILARTLGA